MSGHVRLDVMTDKNYRPVDGDFIIRLAIKMSISDLAETLPLNLCLVIDRSTSMEGSKIESAKASARELIRGLKSEDALTLIGFGSTVQVLMEHQLMTAEGRETAMNAVDGIEVQGATRMDLALDKAYAILKGSGDGSMNALLFLSDGAPTDAQGYVVTEEEREGLQRKIERSFLDHSITTSTIGLGDASECLASFLDRCGEKGGGIFYHADEPRDLQDQFRDAFHRVRETAVSDARFVIRDVRGSIRKAAAIYPDIRDLSVADPASGRFEIDGGSLRKGEEHVFLVEVITPGGERDTRLKLCEVEAVYSMDGVTHRLQGNPPLIEYTPEEALLDKAGHPEVERFKGMYNAFIQTQRASDLIRRGEDPKKTRILLKNAAKTTKRLGLAKQTKLLETMVNRVEMGGSVSENDLTEVSVASRKTKVLG